MTREVRVWTTQSEFDEFLYASLNAENSGLIVSVLSALARLNVDPWEEAARLARLPHDRASLFLAQLITAQPGGSPAGAEADSQAKRLTALLPRPRGSGGRSHPPAGAGIVADHPLLVRWIVFFIVISVILFGSSWLLDKA